LIPLELPALHRARLGNDLRIGKSRMQQERFERDAAGCFYVEAAMA
jgi:hypothetical protein